MPEADEAALGPPLDGLGVAGMMVSKPPFIVLPLRLLPETGSPPGPP